jgi:hypothetical protein
MMIRRDRIYDSKSHFRIEKSLLSIKKEKYLFPSFENTGYGVGLWESGE